MWFKHDGETSHYTGYIIDHLNHTLGNIWYDLAGRSHCVADHPICLNLLIFYEMT